jgi:hypothetical protein
MVLAERPETHVAQPLGPSPIGRVVFTSDGFMSCLLRSAAAVTTLADERSWNKATDEEVVHMARSVITYCGYYHFSNEGGVPLLSTHVDVALDPNWIGSQQIRKREIEQTSDGKTILKLEPVNQFKMQVSLLRSLQPGILSYLRQKQIVNLISTEWCECCV